MAGQTAVVEGAGLVAGQTTLRVDGQVATLLGPIETLTEQGLVQQMLAFTVPAGIGAGVVTVTTAGGTASLQLGVTLTAQPNVSPASDVGDTLAGALVLNLPANRSVQVTQAVGDSVLAGQDVDLYRFNGGAGDLVTIVATPTSGNLLYARLFDAAGNQLAADAFSGPASSPRIVAFRLPAAGNYYIGLSGWANTGYNPTVAGSGATAAPATTSCVWSDWPRGGDDQRPHGRGRHRHAPLRIARLGAQRPDDHTDRHELDQRRSRGVHGR